MDFAPFAFLPVSREDMVARGWYWYDFLVVTGDAYIDHPSFGPTVIARVLEAMGFRVAVLAQPAWQDASAFAEMGVPRLGVMIGGGNLDSMVAHYTAAKRRRSEDFYSPGKKMGLRPDRATIVYANRAREAFPGKPIIIGGMEASLRRFAHYDYWDDKVRRSLIFDAKADLLVYGMGETATREIARRLAAGEDVSAMHDIRGTAFIARDREEALHCAGPAAPAVVADPSPVELPAFETVRADNRAYAQATHTEYAEHDAIRGRAMLQQHGDRWLVVNPPAAPLTTAELDEVAALPYTREPPPMYDEMGGVPAIEEVRFSVIHNRGCFGGCNFCSLAFHQGRMVTSRSHESVIAEVTAMTKHPLWKGYVSDIGGPTANFRKPSCKKQTKCGMCPDRRCLAPEPCPNLEADHSDYLALLRKLRQIPGVKKVFVRSGIRYDYLLEDRDQTFLAELVRYHVSGQLKVAPEHCIDSVLDYMGKPHIGVYEKFMQQYRKLNEKYDKEQYVVPYLMSSHPGSTLDDAIALAEYLNKTGRNPEQVQDFYPTPGTISTCMYHTGLDPRTMRPVYVPKTEREKNMQRALLQFRNPKNRSLVVAALKQAGREDLIGPGKECLVRAYPAKAGKKPAAKAQAAPAAPAKPKNPDRKGWAKAKPKTSRRGGRA